MSKRQRNLQEIDIEELLKEDFCADDEEHFDDFFEKVPKEIIYLMLTFLDTNTLAIVGRISKSWNEISSQNSLYVLKIKAE
jgi:hypothetical protein